MKNIIMLTTHFPLFTFFNNYANNINDEWYEKNICDFTHTLRRGANITDNKGVWVNTSYGDGEYTAQLYMKDGKICGMEIIC